MRPALTAGCFSLLILAACQPAAKDNEAPVLLVGSTSRDARADSGQETQRNTTETFGATVIRNNGVRSAIIQSASLTADEAPTGVHVDLTGIYEFRARGTPPVGVQSWPPEDPTVTANDLKRVKGYVISPGAEVNLVFVVHATTNSGVHGWQRVRLTYRYAGKTKTDEVWNGYVLCVNTRCPGN